MTQEHPDLGVEQAYIDHAYECLEASREAAWRLRSLSEADLGGTFQARFERNAFDEALVKRLADLDLGNASLVFGRIDRYAESPDALESFHIGRLAVADEDREPVVVDWRAPVAEPFYRANELYGLDPTFTISLNRAPLARYLQHRDFMMIVWVMWDANERFGHSVEAHHSIWMARLSDLLPHLLVAPVHHYGQRVHDTQGNNKESFLIPTYIMKKVVPNATSRTECDTENR